MLKVISSKTRSSLLVVTLDFKRLIYREKTPDGKYKFEDENTDETLELDEDFIGTHNIHYLQGNNYSL